MSSYRFTCQAECDLLAIWDFSERRWSADQADRYITGMKAAILERATGRLLGKSCRSLVPECSDEQYFRYESHYIIYRTRDVLEVLAVIHTASSQLLEQFFEFNRSDD